MESYGPSTTNADIADALDLLMQKLSAAGSLQGDDLNLLNEAAERIRERGDEEDEDEDGDEDEAEGE